MCSPSRSFAPRRKKPQQIASEQIAKEEHGPHAAHRPKGLAFRKRYQRQMRHASLVYLLYRCRKVVGFNGDAIELGLGRFRRGKSLLRSRLNGLLIPRSVKW